MKWLRAGTTPARFGILWGKTVSYIYYPRAVRVLRALEVVREQNSIFQHHNPKVVVCHSQLLYT